MRNIQSHLFADEEKVYEKMALLELMVSDNMLSFHSDRVRGRTHPKEVFKGAYQLPVLQHKGFSLFSVLNNKKYREVLQKSGLVDSTYLELGKLLKKYHQRRDSGEEWITIDPVGIRKIEPGDTIEIMPQIARKLYQMGVIEKREIKKANPRYYNASFAPLVKRFQRMFGLYDDGIFGRKTFGLLNGTLQDRIDQISANMERIRWFRLPEDEKPYIAVNLPAFELDLWWPDSVKSMKVCVGKPRPANYNERYERYQKEQKYWLRPPDHETPQISSGVVYMVINPTWTVPRSIITREMFYQMKRDSFYLQKNGYGVFYKGKELRSDSINWSKYRPTKIPFDIVQEAGMDNALGKVKFIFPNPFHIYLHDTPQKSKFKWSERAVSHGCVRVENPLLLGEFLMENVDTANADDFRIWMGHEPLDPERLEEYDPEDSTARIQPLEETEIIRLNKRMPVYFLYRNIWYDHDHQLQIRNDVYDKNRLIIKAMDF